MDPMNANETNDDVDEQVAQGDGVDAGTAEEAAPGDGVDAATAEPAADADAVLAAAEETEPEAAVAETEADEPVEDAAPIVGSSADLGEPYTKTGDTFQVGVDVTESQVPPETGVSRLQDAADEQPLPATNEAVGTGPTDLVDVTVEEEEPLTGAPPTDQAAALSGVPAQAPEVEETKAAETVEEVEEVETAVRDPFRGPGDWYVVHTYAGYENKVKTNLESRIHTMQMEDKIFDVHIPMEDVMEIKGGKKQVVQRKVFPGYLLVKMVYDNDSWYVVRNTPGVTGFVAAGTGSKPTPLSKREVEKILAVKKEEVKPQFRLGFEENDVVRIISGPFADFNGTISEINLDQSKLKVLVNIFDRETPVELSFDQVAKV
jgi:transcriptional antiterminator NusG